MYIYAVDLYFVTDSSRVIQSLARFIRAKKVWMKNSIVNIVDDIKYIIHKPNINILTSLAFLCKEIAYYGDDNANAVKGYIKYLKNLPYAEVRRELDGEEIKD